MNIKYEQVTTFIVEYTENEYTTLLGAIDAFLASTEHTKDNASALDSLLLMRSAMVAKYREAIEYK